MYAAFPRSEYYQRVRLPQQLLPFFECLSVRHTCWLAPQDRCGSPRFLASPFLPCRALRPRRSLPRSCLDDRVLLPSRSSTLSASGCCCYEAQSLHLRYGPVIALSTLDSCRYLHEPKTRFPVRWLLPLAGAGISPAEAAKLCLASQKISPGRQLRRPQS